MPLFGLGKKSTTYLTVVTTEGPGRLRINGLVATTAAKKAAAAHGSTICWAEFSTEGSLLDKGLGRAPTQAGQADRLLRDLPANSTCRAVLDRLREGQESVGKWLQLGEPAAR